MLRFAESDEDLAAVLSHELAHNLLAYHVAHLATMRYELEADYVAVYLAARGGFEISGTAEFMRRWGASSPREIDRGRNHPGTAERVVRIEAAVREVEAKQRRGEDLVPDGLRLTAGR
jgi:predicted Zn-dependent protease